MHRLLERQLRHAFGDPPVIPEGLGQFLETVSKTYSSFDEDRLLLEHSLELSSKEFFENSQKLSDAKENIEKIVIERTEELTEEHANLLASINSLSIGLLIVDTENNVVIANRALSTILGLAQTDAPARFEDVERALQGAMFLRNYYREFPKGGGKGDTKEFVLGDRYLRVLLAPITLPEYPDEVIGTVMTVEDTTEAKVLEQSREEFFSIASHELRTPLTAIRGNASMLLDYYSEKLVDPDMHQMVEDMLTSSVRLIRIVNDFLDVSRLEQKRMQFHSEKFDVAQLVQNSVEELLGVAQARSLSLEFAPVSEKIEAYADPARVKQVLMNLVGNAVNYTQKGGVVISVTRAGQFVNIAVKDTGIGIPRDQYALLFRKFQQVGEKIHSRDVMSTGLGLYISKLMVEGMGGEIGLVQSVPGEGSTFALTLPVEPPLLAAEDTKPEVPQQVLIV